MYIQLKVHCQNTLRGGAVEARRSHNPEVAGSNPAPASAPPAQRRDRGSHRESVPYTTMNLAVCIGAAVTLGSEKRVGAWQGRPPTSCGVCRVSVGIHLSGNGADRKRARFGSERPQVRVLLSRLVGSTAMECGLPTSPPWGCKTYMDGGVGGPSKPTFPIPPQGCKTFADSAVATNPVRCCTHWAMGA